MRFVVIIILLSLVLNACKKKAESTVTGSVTQIPVVPTPPPLTAKEKALLGNWILDSTYYSELVADTWILKEVKSYHDSINCRIKFTDVRDKNGMLIAENGLNCFVDITTWNTNGPFIGLMLGNGYYPFVALNEKYLSLDNEFAGVYQRTIYVLRKSGL